MRKFTRRYKLFAFFRTNILLYFMCNTFNLDRFVSKIRGEKWNRDNFYLIGNARTSYKIRQYILILLYEELDFLAKSQI